MKTYAITNYTNYGETILIINANSMNEALEIGKKDNRLWSDCDIKEIDTTTEGVVFYGGGDYK